MLPEPEVTSSSTVPLTCKVRSKCPVVAALTGRTASKSAHIASARNFTDFMFPSKLKSGLLQDYLLALVQAGKQFGFRSVGDSHGHGQFFSSVLGAGFGDLDGCFAVFVIDERAFGNHKNSFMFFQ